ncbi:MAG: hypothetical protein IJZ17_04200, partial [Muribaculaceae bacterium]|nr:hypothetical protein [Muribaculaceae bacterium]
VSSNSLGSYGYDSDDLDEMTTGIVNANSNSRLLVYRCSYNADPTLTEITKDGEVMLKQYSTSISSVSIDRMTEVFTDMAILAPAEDYGLVMWSHSSGWLGETGNTPSDIQPKSWGEDRSKTMTISDLATALHGQPFSFIYFDCCYMGNIESLYELRNTAPYIIASPTETHLDGMPYDVNVPAMLDENIDLKAIVDNTYNYYNARSGKNRSCTLALYDMSKINDVADATESIFANSTSVSTDFTPQLLGTGNTFSPYFFDFGHYITSLTNDEILIDRFNNCINDFVIHKVYTPSIYFYNLLNIEHFSGLSTYIINESDDIRNKGYMYTSWWLDVMSPYFTTE